MKKTMLAALCAMLAACTTALGPVQDVARDTVSILDSRPDSERKTSIPDINTPWIVLGDESFDVSPLVYLKNAIYANRRSDTAHVDVIISRFSLVDYFPRQAREVHAAELGALGLRNYQNSSEVVVVTDSILCTLEANINGRDVKATVAVPYEISPLALLGRGEDGRIAALKQSINDCAEYAMSAAEQ